MSWQVNKPLSSDLVSAGPAVLTGNWSAIQNIIGVDHETFTAAAGIQGKHKKVTFPPQASSPTFAANEQGLYNREFNNGTTTNQQLYVRKQIFGGTERIPLTASVRDQDTLTNITTTGWTYLASGILLKWTNVTVPLPAGQATFDMNGGGKLGPNFQKIFNVVGSLASNTAGTFSIETATPNITVYSPGGQSVRVLVIGV